jgi:hypothetical protein
MTITAMTTMVAMMAVKAAAAHGGQPQPKLTVYMRDRADVSNEIRLRAESLASRMFATIGISLQWRKGEPSGQLSQPPVFIELARKTPKNWMPGTLAYALPYEGAHLTVFFDRIEKGDDPGTVLAHVMVHEITHLLQGVNRHSAAGVMKARWTIGDFDAMRFVTPLPFTAEDVDLIYLGLAARTARAGAPADRH